MNEKMTMKVEDFRMLNDYLKMLTHAQSNGVKVGNEIQEVVKKINEGLGLNVKRYRSNYNNANNESVVTEWTQVGDEVSDINQTKLNNTIFHKGDVIEWGLNSQERDGHFICICADSEIAVFAKYGGYEESDDGYRTSYEEMFVVDNKEVNHNIIRGKYKLLSRK